ncbi:hypothetical protein Tco_1498577, partial [Tanacetum coccineum]
MVYFVDGVLASGVEIILEMDFVRFALQELEIDLFMIQIRILSIILQRFSTTLHSPSSRHTRVSYVGTILIMVMIVHHEYRLSMSRNRATIKTLVIIIIHKIHRFFHNNIFVVKSVGHEKFQCQPRNQNFYEPNLCCENCRGPHENFNQPPQYSIDHQPRNIQEDLNQQRINDVLKAIQSLVEKLRQQEQAANLSTHTPEPSRRFNFIYDDDDDDEESTIPLSEIISQLPPSIAITPSSVEDLVPIPSESKDTSDNDSECDLPFCDDSPPLDVLGGNYVTFSNPLFNANDDFTSSDDESLPEEDVQEGDFKIYSNPLFEFNDEYISSDVNPLFNEVLEDIENKDSYDFNIDEPVLLVTPLSNANEDECFDPGGDMDEINAFLDMDVSTDIEVGYHDSKGDEIFLEYLLKKIASMDS